MAKTCVTRYTVDPKGRQPESDKGEGTEQDQEETASRERIANHIFQRLNVVNRLIAIWAAHKLAQNGDYRQRRSVRSDHQLHAGRDGAHQFVGLLDVGEVDFIQRKRALVQAIDPLTFCAAILTVPLISLAAIAIPAHRASQVEPIKALHREP